MEEIQGPILIPADVNRLPGGRPTFSLRREMNSQGTPPAIPFDYPSGTPDAIPFDYPSGTPKVIPWGNPS